MTAVTDGAALAYLSQTGQTADAFVLKWMAVERSLHPAGPAAPQPSPQDLAAAVVAALRQEPVASATKGKAGEAWVHTELERLLPGAVVTDRSGRGGACDFAVEQAGCTTVAVEVKSYAKAVPSAEVAKFRRDLLTNQQHGLLLSLDSQVAGRQPFELEVVEGRWLAVSIGCARDSMPLVKLAIQAIQTIEREWAKADGGAGGGVCYSAEKVQGAITEVNRLSATLQSLRQLHRTQGALLESMCMDGLLGILCSERGAPAAAALGVEKASALRPAKKAKAVKS